MGAMGAGRSCFERGAHYSFGCVGLHVKTMANIRTPRTRRQRRRGILIGIPVFIAGAVVALLFAAQVYDSSVGCESVDPTDPANYSSIAILNNTPSPVLVGDCPGAYCQTNTPPIRLSPGESFSDDAACGAAGSAMTSWRVTRLNGSTVGFIAVDTPKSAKGLVFRVSNAGRSRLSPTRPG